MSRQSVIQYRILSELDVERSQSAARQSESMSWTSYHRLSTVNITEKMMR